jgi:DNA-binding CsgD family transcriptional regulator
MFEELGARPWADKAREELGRISGRRAPSDELTDAERRVAVLAAEGRHNKEIAAQLFIGVGTFEAHLSRVYRTFGVRSRAEPPAASPGTRLRKQGNGRLKHEGFLRFGRGGRSVASPVSSRGAAPPSTTLPTQEHTMAFIDVSRQLLVRPTAAARPSDDADAATREHTRAGVALAIAWAGLAVVFGAYAIAERSVGAVVSMLVVLTILRVAWTGSWYEEDSPAATVEREIRLLP